MWYNLLLFILLSLVSILLYKVQLYNICVGKLTHKDHVILPQTGKITWYEYGICIEGLHKDILIQ